MTGRRKKKNKDEKEKKSRPEKESQCRNNAGIIMQMQEPQRCDYVYSKYIIGLERYTASSTEYYMYTEYMTWMEILCENNKYIAAQPRSVEVHSRCEP